MALSTRDMLLREFEGRTDLVWSETEQIRLDAYKTEAQRQRLKAGHRLGRRLLQDRIGGEIRDWRLNGMSGEPPTVANHPELHLSISHSGEWFACALSDAPVGIDIEVLRLQRDVPALAEMICNEEESNGLNGLDENERALRFTQIWTLKEAWLKQQGQGLDFSQMRRLSVTPAMVLNAEAMSWFDASAGLSIALASSGIGKMQPDSHVWPDGLHPLETGCWTFVVASKER